MALTAFSVLWSHCCCPFPKRFHQPRQRLCPRQAPAAHPRPQPLATTTLISVSQLDYSGPLRQVESHNVCPSVSGCFRSASCSQVHPCCRVCQNSLPMEGEQQSTAWTALAVYCPVGGHLAVSTFWLLRIALPRTRVCKVLFAHLFPSVGVQSQGRLAWPTIPNSDLRQPQPFSDRA